MSKFSTSLPPMISVVMVLIVMKCVMKTTNMISITQHIIHLLCLLCLYCFSYSFLTWSFFLRVNNSSMRKMERDKSLRTNDLVNITDNITIRKNEFSTNKNIETYLGSFPTWYIAPLSTSIIKSNLVESYICELSLSIKMPLSTTWLLYLKQNIRTTECYIATLYYRWLYFKNEIVLIMVVIL